MKEIPYGRLYVVATPIGNLDDFSVRCQTSLKRVSWIAAEDTRHSQTLLRSFGIQQKLYSLHEYNEKSQLEVLIASMKEGASGALISDAGTPAISDPGFYLIQAAHEAGIQVIPVPGPCAVVLGLSALAIQQGPFHFEGFLGAKSKTRQDRLHALKAHTSTLVFYEAPHRIKDFFADLVEVFGPDRFVGIGRELTKKFESLYRGSALDLKQKIDEGMIPARGEFMVVVEGAPVVEQVTDFNHETLIKTLLTYLPINKVAKIASQLTSLDRKQSYDLALKFQDKKAANLQEFNEND